MDLEDFWTLINCARLAVDKTTEVPNWLRSYLEKQEVSYIGDFQLCYRELSEFSYDARLWSAASIIMKYCSDDKFMDFRAWLIAKGKSTFENAVGNPDTLAKVEMDGDYGLPILFKMNYVAEKAYRAKIGEMADITDIISNPRKFILKNEQDLVADRQRLERLLPKLFTKYGKEME